MRTALIFNRESGLSKVMTAPEFEREFAGNAHRKIIARLPEERDKLDIISEEHGVHMGFRRSYFYDSGKKIARAAFVLPKGYGRRQHMYEHGAEDDITIEEAVKSGKHILIRLNQQFIGQNQDFDPRTEPDGRNLKQWIGQVHGDYAAFSANSATEVAQKLRLAKKHHDGSDRLTERLWFMHRGVILPFKHVIIDNDQQKLKSLYDQLAHNNGGINISGYRVGFPRFLRFVPTQEKKQGGLVFGNHQKLPVGKPLLTQLTCPTVNGQTDLDAYGDLKRLVYADRENGTWVLASPYVQPGSHDPDHMPIIRWDVRNAEMQIHAINDNSVSGAKPVTPDHVQPGAKQPRVKPGIRSEPGSNTPSL